MKDIKKVMIVGAGFMGAGIAQVVAEAGYPVLINDVSEEIISRALKSIYGQWERKLKKEKITEEQLEQYKQNIKGCADLEEAANADLVIEAIIEDLNAKADIFHQLSEICRDDVLLCSNTSSIPITELAMKTAHPENFLGMHFFSPVPAMKLLELIPGLCTSDEALRAIKDFGSKIGKICVVSKDSAGFIVNRLLVPMLNDAVQLVNDHVGTVEDIDNGMRYGCSHPMGPLELLDMVGLDIACAVMQVLYKEFSDTKYRAAPLLRQMVRAGYLGKKTGKGFYVYDERGKKCGVNPIFQ